MRTGAIILFVLLIAVVAAPFILNASRQIALKTKEMWQDELDEGEQQTQEETKDE